MKKYLIVLMSLLICFLCPISVGASQVDIDINVPSQHSVSIRGEHVSADYLDEGEEDSDVYPVPRFSEPEFRLKADENWQIERVLLNDVDVTNQVNNGVIKLPRVSEDQVITVETKAVSSANAANTADDGSIWIWGSLFLLGAGAIAIVLTRSKKDSQKKLLS